MSAPRPENMRSPAKAWLRALEATAPIERGQAPILPLLIDTLAERFEAAPALLAREGSLTYRALAQAVSRYARWGDRKSTRLNSSHRCISYAVFCLKKKKK